MKWFGRKAAREGVRPALFGRLWRGIGSDWAGGDTPLSYEGQVRAAYMANPVAQRAVRIVAEGVGSAPIYAAEGEPRAAALVTAELLERAATFLLLNGNAYVQIAQTPSGDPAELHVLRPERVTVETDLRGWPVAYAAYFYMQRDEAAGGAPPAAVTALLRPWRRMRLA